MVDVPVISGNKQETRNALGRFVKGVSGNPKGKPVGATSVKVFAREYLLSLPTERKIQLMERLEREDFELLWKMAEGNPHSTEDVTHTVAPTPIMKLETVKVDEPRSALPDSAPPPVLPASPSAPSA